MKYFCPDNFQKQSYIYLLSMWLFIISLLDYKLQENSNYICFLFYYDHISTCLVENKYLSKNELNEVLLKYSPLLS